MVMTNRSKKGQAAIEFLMTYGWMLLVVLIVGALIFSFVDFGNLIPNQISMSNNIQADASRSIAYAQDNDNPLENTISVVFQYNGARQAQIAPGEGSWIRRTIDDSECELYNITNLNTGDSANTDEIEPEPVTFLNSHEGLADYECENDLLSGDTVEGDIRLTVQDPQTNRGVPSTGDIRLTIVDG